MWGRDTWLFTVPLSVNRDDATHTTVPEQVIDHVFRCFPDRLVEVLHAMRYRRGCILTDEVLGEFEKYACASQDIIQ